MSFSLKTGVVNRIVDFQNVGWFIWEIIFLFVDLLRENGSAHFCGYYLGSWEEIDFFMNYF